MKKRKKRSYHFKTKVTQQASRPPVRDLEPEALVAYIHEAEKLVLPLMKERGLGPGATELLLAQYTQILVTGDPRITVESGMAIANTVLGLWQEGYYMPGPEYPYTLEETLQELEEGGKAKGDYGELFQPCAPQNGETPRGLGEIAGGIVKHPETNLWQIWLMIDGPCAFFGAYHDPIAAQGGLAAIIAATRRGATQKEGLALYHRLSQQGDGEPRQLPYDMVNYLVEHLDRYLITL